MLFIVEKHSHQIMEDLFRRKASCRFFIILGSMHMEIFKWRIGPALLYGAVNKRARTKGTCSRGVYAKTSVK